MRFSVIFCSQCGEAFGPGDEGFSHCEDHANMVPWENCEAWLEERTDPERRAELQPDRHDREAQ